ncbi:GntR family transcriptional regulator [Neotabrizicola sp. VNH66]|uniref:GntR family transcriptional regulator n=1 Tax=Neotabrizicola sp. VNH66 TaxID=3400918 RepID=UPI003C0A112D
MTLVASDQPIAALPPIGDLRQPTVTDLVFDALYARVVNLSLPPGAKLSEAEVAAQMGVSRQPVRDAFYRLSQMGFIQIRPQRATLVTRISKEAVMKAMFIRSSLEEACIRTAVTKLTDAHLDALDEVVDRQDAAVKGDRRSEFHALDDRFHHDICSFSGLGFVWALVKENKGHMDRTRFLSLSAGAPSAHADHLRIMEALHARDTEAATLSMRQHLGKIEGILNRLNSDQPGIFCD